MATIAAVVRWADNTADLQRHLREGANQIEATKASVDKLVQSFSGEKLIQAAHRNVAAIKQMGDASMLSASQAQRSLGLITDAIATLERQSKPVPDALRAMKTELEGLVTQAPAVEGLGARITGLVAAAAAAREAIRGLVTIVTDWIAASSAQEDALVRLDTALRAQGTFTPQLAQQYADLADQFQKTTVFSDELVMEMEALLVQVGDVMPDQMGKALKASTDLAAGLRIDLQTATMLVGKAFAGETGTLKRYGIVIDEVALKTRGAEAVLDAIAAKMGGQATAQAQTFSGQMQRLANIIDDVKERLGGFIASVLTPLIDLFMDLPEPVRTGTVALGLIGAAAAATAIAVAGLSAAVALALPLFGMSAAGAGASALTALGAAASVAVAPFLALASAIAAVWAAWKIGEAVQNDLATWVLSSNTGYAAALRLVLGLDKLGAAEARMAVQATDAAAAQADLNRELSRLNIKPVSSHASADVSMVTGAFSVEQLERQAEARKRMAEATKKAADDQRRWNEQVRQFSGPAKGFETDLAMMHFRMGQFADATLDADQRAIGLLGTLDQFKATQVPELPSRQIGTGLGTGPAHLPLPGFVRPGIFDNLNLGSSIPQTILAALEGGGSVVQSAASGIGAQIGTNLVAKFGASITKNLGKTFGGAINAVLPGIGALAGPLIGLIGKLFGPSEESSKVSPLRDEFFKMAGGLEKLNPLVFQLTGNLKLVQAVFDAKTVEQYNAAIANLQALLDTQKTAFADLEAAAQRYGFTLEELGPALQRQKLGEQAQQIFKDWQLLNAAGIDTAVIGKRMADTINTYVQNAIKMGVEVPEAMRPMLQQMIQMGLLTDASGKAITNLEDAGISFTMTMSEGFKALITEVQKLTNAIRVGLGLAIENIPDPDMTVHVQYDVPKGGIPHEFPTPVPHLPGHVYDGGGPSGEIVRAAMGGLVTANGIQRFAAGGRVLQFPTRGLGADTVPAMLTPGELVLNKAQQATLGGGGPIVVNVTVNAGHIATEHDLTQAITKSVLDGIEKGGTNFGRFRKFVRQAA